MFTVGGRESVDDGVVLVGSAGAPATGSRPDPTSAGRAGRVTGAAAAGVLSVLGAPVPADPLPAGVAPAAAGSGVNDDEDPTMVLEALPIRVRATPTGDPLNGNLPRCRICTPAELSPPETESLPANATVTPEEASALFNASRPCLSEGPPGLPGRVIPLESRPTVCPRTLTPVTSVSEVVTGLLSPGCISDTVCTCTSAIFSTPTSMPRVMLSAIEVMVPSAAMVTEAFCTDPEVTITPAVGPAALAPDTAERGPDSALSTTVPLGSCAEAFGVRLPSVTTYSG